MRNVTIFRSAGAVLMTRRRVVNVREDLRVRPELWEVIHDPTPLLAVGESLEVRR